MQPRPVRQVFRSLQSRSRPASTWTTHQHNTQKLPLRRADPLHLPGLSRVAAATAAPAAAPGLVGNTPPNQGTTTSAISLGMVSSQRFAAGEVVWKERPLACGVRPATSNVAASRKSACVSCLRRVDEADAPNGAHAAADSTACYCVCDSCKSHRVIWCTATRDDGKRQARDREGHSSINSPTSETRRGSYATLALSLMAHYMRGTFEQTTQALVRQSDNSPTPALWSLLGQLCYAESDAIASQHAADGYKWALPVLQAYGQRHWGLGPQMVEAMVPLAVWQRVYAILQLNTFSLFYEQQHGEQPSGAAVATQEYAGSALFFVSSFFNHSCRPNIEMRPLQPSAWSTGTIGHTAELFPWVQLVALRSIAPGEPLTVAYTDVSESTSAESRSSYLQWAYGFDCRCERCQEEQQGSIM